MYHTILEQKRVFQGKQNTIAFQTNGTEKKREMEEINKRILHVSCFLCFWIHWNLQSMI